MKLEKEIFTLGKFWLPEEPTIKLYGALTIKKDGRIHLILNQFSDYSSFLTQKPLSKQLNNLHGCTYDLKNIALQGLQPNTSYPSESGNALQATYTVEMAITNLNDFDPNSYLQSNSMTFTLENLNEWFPREVISEHIQNYSKIILAKLDDNLALSAKAYLSSSYQYGANYRYKLTLESKNSALKLRDLQRKTHCLARFFSFAMDSILPITSIRAYNTNMDHWSSVSLYYPSALITKKTRQINQDYFLFSFKDVEYSINNIIEKWFELTDTIEPALNLYFAAQIHDDNFLETRFILMAQCLETLHRWNPESAHKVNFNDRINQLINPFGKYLKSHNDLDLSNNIKTLRNYFTHYNKNLTDKIPTTEIIVKILSQMKAIFQLNILKLLSFSEEEIDTIVQNNRQLQWNLWMIEE